MATLIGLCIRVRLLRCLPARFKVWKEEKKIKRRSRDMRRSQIYLIHLWQIHLKKKLFFFIREHHGEERYTLVFSGSFRRTIATSKYENWHISCSSLSSMSLSTLAIHNWINWLNPLMTGSFYLDNLRSTSLSGRELIRVSMPSTSSSTTRRESPQHWRTRICWRSWTSAWPLPPVEVLLPTSSRDPLSSTKVINPDAPSVPLLFFFACNLP